MAIPQASAGYKKPASIAEMRDGMGLPEGKKASVLNLARIAKPKARPGGGLATAFKRRPKPGMETNI
jgi:hypothetical protein